MKRATPTSLSLLLSGNQNKKAKVGKIHTDDKQLSSTKKASIAATTPRVGDTSSENEVIDLIDDEDDRTQHGEMQQDDVKVIRHIIPEGRSVKAQSVKSFLLSRKPVSKEKNEHIEVNQTQNANNTTIDIVESDEEDIPQIIQDNTPQTIHDGPISFQQSKLTSTSSNIKKTKLKDLFARFGPPVDNVSASDYHGPKIRCHQISKLKTIDAPLPNQQLVQPDDADAAIHDYTYSKFLTKPTNSSYNTASSSPNFGIDEYISLNNARTECLEDKDGEVVNYKISPNKYFIQWPELFKPKSLRHVMLESKVRDDVSTWVETSLNKLKRPTTRNKLLKTYKEEDDMFKNFIIHDDEDDQQTSLDDGGNNGDIEEFVPLMILHGDGVGKDTLIHTIAQEKNCQIYEINTSQNRGRKDIYDILSEYCTSHFVKDKKVPGLVVLSDVDVIFKEHDRLFWTTLERLLLKSRKPIILTCDDLNFIPTSLIDICTSQESIFKLKKATTRTVVAYLEKYCQTLELKLEKTVLEMIVNKNNRDIRKCLMQMQFWFSSESKLRMATAKSTATIKTSTDIKELGELTDLYSMGDLLACNSAERSQILQEDDPTLMTNDILMATHQSTDDEYKLKHDYMEDYRIHVPHYNHSLLMPFELNIGSMLLDDLTKNYSHFAALNHKYPHKYNRIRTESIAFLETHIKSPHRQKKKRLRETRNSRKMRSILKNFQGILPQEGQVDEDVLFDFAITNTTNLRKDILPYTYELASHDQKSRQYNHQLYMVSTDALDENKRAEMVNQLIEEDMFKPLWFSRSPEGVIKAWK